MNSFPTPEPGAEPPPPPHGWYPDPASGERLRLWTGSAWTDQVRSRGSGAPGDPEPISFVRPGAPAATARPADAPSAGSSSYGTPVDFRGRALARPESSRAPVANPRGPKGGQTADGVPLASWGERLVATIADWAVNLVLVALVLTFAVKDFWGRYLAESNAWADAVIAGQAEVLSLSPELMHLGVLMTTAASGVSMVYGVALLGTAGATLGQRLLKLQVVPFGRGRGRIGWLQAIVRTFIWTLLAQGGGFVLLLQLVNVLLPLWHPHKQTIHDLISRTQVVKREPSPQA